MMQNINALIPEACVFEIHSSFTHHIQAL